MKKSGFWTMLLAWMPLFVSAQPAINAHHDVVLTMQGIGNDDFTFKDNREEKNLSSCKLTTSDDGQKVIEVEVVQANGNAYNCELGLRSKSDVKKGDVMQAIVTMRTVYARQETGESSAYFYFQRAVSPWEKSLRTQLCGGSEWKTYSIPFVQTVDLKAGEAIAALAFGTLRQKVQISKIEVLNYHQNCKLEDLPVTRLTYAGREAGAQWRKDALQRIEKLRTAPLTINVVDANGKAVKGAEVDIKMRRSAFIWGTAVGESTLAGDDADSQKYKETLKNLFNTAVIENGFKAGGWCWEDQRKQQTLKAFQWLEDNGFRQRGHNLVWPGWKFNPRSSRMIAERDTAAFNQFILGQFRERMAVTKGKVIAWDVVNEMMHEKDFFPYLPKDVTVEWFKEAKRLDPDAKLFINDYAMMNGTHSPIVIKEYIDLIKDLRSKGAPVEAAGVQGHVGTQPRSPIQIISDFDLFYKERIPVQITEFDINTDDEELQADYTRDFLIACYSHPACEGVTLWGFWQKRHWKPLAAMYRPDWTEKANGRIWRELVCDKWATRWTKKSDKHGRVNGKAHLGEYDITVRYKDKCIITPAALDSDGLTITVNIQ